MIDGRLCWCHGLRPAPVNPVVQVKFVPGGFEDGSPDETLQVESPDQPHPNAAPSHDHSVELETQDVLAAMLELSKRAADGAEQVVAKEGADVLHFYPPETEALLVDAERSFASRSEGDIRRTYFVIVRRGAGFGFAVTRQTYWR